jgi:uncharacterized membrane protein YeaQ/YmgE (transglycosylase-associated protein family)
LSSYIVVQLYLRGYEGVEDTKVYMSGESLLIILVVGLIAGWLAGQIVQDTGFGIVGDLLIGIVGAFIGSWLLPQLGIHLGLGIVAAIINATIGALILLLSSGSFSFVAEADGGGVGADVVANRLLRRTRLGAVVGCV